MTLAENSEREDASPFYTAKLFQMILEAAHLGEAQLAERLRKDPGDVNRCLALLRLAPEVQANLVQTKLTMTHLREIMRLGTPEEQLRMAEACETGDWSCKALKAKVDKALAGPEKEAKGPAEPAGDVKPIRFSWKDGKLAVKIQPVDPDNLQGFLADVEVEWKRFVDLHPKPQAAKSAVQAKEEEVAQAA
jgi:ParB-like protein